MKNLFALSLMLSVGACAGSSVGVSSHNASAMGKLSNSVLAVAGGPLGVWVGTDNGLGRYSNGDWVTKWKGRMVTALAPGGKNVAYAGASLLKTVVHTKAQMRDSRVYRMMDRRGKLREEQLGGPMEGDTVKALFRDRKGDLWIGMMVRGVMISEKGEEDPVSVFGPAQLGGHPTSFAEAPDGTVYIGSFGGGVHVIKGRKIVKTYTPKNSDLRGNGVVRSVAFHPQLGLLCATANLVPGATVGDIDAQSTGTGVSQFIGGKWKSWTAGGGLKSNNVSQVAVAPNGAIWFTSLNAGVSVYRGGKWFHPPVADDTTYGVSFGGNGNVWVGTGRGVSNVRGF